METVSSIYVKNEGIKSDIIIIRIVIFYSECYIYILFDTKI